MVFRFARSALESVNKVIVSELDRHTGPAGQQNKSLKADIHEYFDMDLKFAPRIRSGIRNILYL